MVQPAEKFLDDRGIVQAHWEMLRAFIEASGGEVVVLKPHDLSDESSELYVRDRMFVIPEKKIAVISLRDKHEALLEQAEARLRHDGYTIKYMNELMDGGNVIYHPDGYILQGVYDDHDRNKLGNEFARKELEEATGMPVIPVKVPNRQDYVVFNENCHVTQERFFHLDLMMNVLPDGQIFIPEHYLYKNELKDQIAKITGREPAFVELPLGHPVNYIQIGKNIITEDPRIWEENIPDDRMDEAIQRSGCKARHIFSITPEWEGDTSRLDPVFQKKVFASLQKHGRADLCSNEELLGVYDESMYRMFEINRGNARCLTQPLTPAETKAISRTRNL